MKNKKSIILTLVTILLFSFAAMGCGDKVSPKESAQILWDAKIKEDVSNVKKLGQSDEDGQKFLEENKKAEIQLLKTGLQVSGIKATDDQLESIYKAGMEACAKNTVTIEEVSKSGDSAEVKVTSTYIDETGIAEQAVDEAVKEAQASGIKNQNEMAKKIGELYIEKLVNGLKNAEVSSDTVEKTFKFKKNKDGYWEPESAKDYVIAISKMATNQK